MKKALYVERTNTLFFPVNEDTPVNLAIEMVKSIRAQGERVGFNVVIATGVSYIESASEIPHKRKRRIGKVSY